MEWLRWYHGACSDSKWPLIARKSGVSVGVVVSVWAALLECASQDEARGSVVDFDGETFDALYGYDDGTCAAVVDAMREKGIICDGCICSWKKRQPLRERDDNSAERVREYRNRKRQETPHDTDETPCNASVTPRNAQIRTDKIREENIKTPPLPPHGGGDAVETSPTVTDPADVDMGFHEFMAAYPAGHRAPEGEAAAVWKKLAREKKLPGLPRLFQGLDAWEACEQWQKDGGAYIPKASNFLRHMQWRDEAPKALPRASPRAPTVHQKNVQDFDNFAMAELAARGLLPAVGDENGQARVDFTQIIDVGGGARDIPHAVTAGTASR